MLLSLDRSPQTGEFSPSLPLPSHRLIALVTPLLPSRHECLGARDLDSPSFYPRSGPAGEGIEDEGLRSSDRDPGHAVGGPSPVPSFVDAKSPGPGWIPVHGNEIDERKGCNSIA